MKLFFLILATLATINYSFSQAHLSDEDEKAIRLVMSMQEDAWNAGDIVSLWKDTGNHNNLFLLEHQE